MVQLYLLVCNILELFKNYQKTAFGHKLKYTPILKTLFILIKISVHSKITSMHILGNTVLADGKRLNEQRGIARRALKYVLKLHLEYFNWTIMLI